MAEREWREAADLQPSRAGFAVVLAAAAILRFWKPGYGVPHAIGPLEPEIVDRAFNMMRAGTLDPEFYDYGSLSISLQLGVSVVRFVLGSMAGEWFSLAEATSHPFYPWGRALVALFGVLTVLLAFRAGLRWGARHALLGAALVAVLPLHVRYSQVVAPDVLLTFLATLTLTLALSATDRRSALAYMAAGFTAGLAMATRYSGALTVVMPLVACLMAGRTGPARISGVLSTVAGMLLGFLLAAPYTVLNLPVFLDRFGALAARARAEAGDGSSALGTALLLQFGQQGGVMRMLVVAALVLMMLGIGMAAVRWLRGPARIPSAAALAFVTVQAGFVMWLGSADPVTLLPAMPVLCILTSVGVFSGLSLLRSYSLGRGPRRALAVGLTVLALLPGTVASIQYLRDRTKRSTEDLAYEWIRRHVPPNAVVVVEASAMSIPRGVVVGRGIDELRKTTYDDLAREGVNYVIASSRAYSRYLEAPAVYRQEYLEYTRLFSEAREVARFSPSRAHPGAELRVLQILP